MQRKSGERDVLTVVTVTTDGVVLSSESLPQPTESTQIVYSSKDYGDPEMGMVIQWHLSLCVLCMPNTGIPIGFGHANPFFCPEYWEIIEEYREYEGHYAMRGNP